MANDNTNRRQLYLPKELDDWYIETYGFTGVKINTLMLNALNEYKENHSKKANKKDVALERKIVDLIEACLESKGL